MLAADGRLRARALRSRRLQGLQRPLRPPGRRRDAGAPRRAPRRAHAAVGGRAYRHGRRRVLRAARRARPTRGRRSRSAAPRFRTRGRLQRQRAVRLGDAGRGDDARRDAAARRPAPVRATRARHVSPLSQTRDVLRACSRSAARRRRAPFADVVELAGATAAELGLADARDRARPADGRAPRHRQDRDPGRDPRQARPLDAREWEYVRRHATIGERIVGSAPALERIARLVRSTHERVDGMGYPDGLAGDEIPPGARSSPSSTRSTR